MESTKNKGVIVATNPAINRFAEAQEECLQKLIKRVETPFDNIWEYLQWAREAKMLELSQFGKNTLYLDNRAVYGFLIKRPNDEEPTPETDEERAKRRRHTIVQIIHNDLIITFANARIEMLKRETGEDTYDGQK